MKENKADTSKNTKYKIAAGNKQENLRQIYLLLYMTGKHVTK